MTKKLDPEEKAARAAARAAKRQKAKEAKEAEKAAEKVAEKVTEKVVSVVPLVARPVANVAQAKSLQEEGAVVWEDISYCPKTGRACQWRAWYDGAIVGVVTMWKRRVRKPQKGQPPYVIRFASAALEKRVGAYPGEDPSWVLGDDQSTPPSSGALNAVSYAVVGLMTAGAAVEADRELLADLGDAQGPEADVVRAASASLSKAHEARYEVDELDEEAVTVVDAAVQRAIDASERAWNALFRSRQTPEERHREAFEAIEASKASIEAFNSMNASAGRKA